MALRVRYSSLRDPRGERFGKFRVQGRVSPVPPPKAMSVESSAASSRSWLRRVLLAPGRVFFLAVLSLMELFELPKIRRLPAPGRELDQSPREVQ